MEVVQARGSEYTVPELGRRWTSQVWSGLQYLHGIPFLHGDLKPDNILLTQDPVFSACARVNRCFISGANWWYSLVLESLHRDSASCLVSRRCLRLDWFTKDFSLAPAGAEP